MSTLTGRYELKSQAVLNLAFNDDIDALAVYDKPLAPTSSNVSNPSLVVSYNAAGDVIKLEKTINGTTYTKTISNDDEVVSTTKTISAWS